MEKEIQRFNLTEITVKIIDSNRVDVIINKNNATFDFPRNDTEQLIPKEYSEDKSNFHYCCGVVLEMFPKHYRYLISLMDGVKNGHIEEGTVISR